MAADVDELLKPVSDDNPAGEDLDYDPDRDLIREAFEGGGGDEDAEPTDWRAIIKLIEGQAKRTQDIWLPVYLCRAGARAGRLEVVEQGAQYLGGMLERFWPTMYPQLDELGFQGRKGPCEGLTRIGEFLGPLRKVPLLVHPRLGRFSGLDLDRFATAGATADGYGMFMAAITEDGGAALSAALGQIDAIRDGFRRADAVLTVNAEDDTATNWQPAYEVIDSLRRSIAHFASDPGAATGEAAPEEPVAADGPVAAADFAALPAPAAADNRKGGGGLTRVESRDDVLKVLDAVSDYYQRKEPTSPVPLVLARAREWVSADFMTLLADLAPTGVDEVRKVLQKRES